MSLPIDAAPPRHIPPTGSAPWPIQPPPHGAAVETIPVRPVARRGGAFGLASALVATAAATAIGLAVALPLLIGRKTRPAGRRRRMRA